MVKIFVNVLKTFSPNSIFQDDFNGIEFVNFFQKKNFHMTYSMFEVSFRILMVIVLVNVFENITIEKFFSRFFSSMVYYTFWELEKYLISKLFTCSTHRGKD